VHVDDRHHLRGHICGGGSKYARDVGGCYTQLGCGELVGEALGLIELDDHGSRSPTHELQLGLKHLRTRLTLVQRRDDAQLLRDLMCEGQVA
jgi:hypothetical protein